jgi:hypothetical protein
LEHALNGGTLPWSDEIASRLLELGSIVAWRWVIKEYIEERQRGSTLRTIWYRVSSRHRLSTRQPEQIAMFFIEVAHAAVEVDGGDRLAPTLYDAWRESGQRLTLEEVRTIRQILSPAAARLRTALLTRPNESGSSKKARQKGVE